MVADTWGHVPPSVSASKPRTQRHSIGHVDGGYGRLGNEKPDAPTYRGGYGRRSLGQPAPPVQRQVYHEEQHQQQPATDSPTSIEDEYAFDLDVLPPHARLPDFHVESQFSFDVEAMDRAARTSSVEGPSALKLRGGGAQLFATALRKSLGGDKSSAPRRLFDGQHTSEHSVPRYFSDAQPTTCDCPSVADVHASAKTRDEKTGAGPPAAAGVSSRDVSSIQVPVPANAGEIVGGDGGSEASRRVYSRISTPPRGDKVVVAIQSMANASVDATTPEPVAIPTAGRRQRPRQKSWVLKHSPACSDEADAKAAPMKELTCPESEAMQPKQGRSEDGRSYAQDRRRKGAAENLN